MGWDINVTVRGLIHSLCILKYNKQVTKFTIVRKTFFFIILKKDWQKQYLSVLNRCKTLEGRRAYRIRISWVVEYLLAWLFIFHPGNLTNLWVPQITRKSLWQHCRRSATMRYSNTQSCHTNMPAKVWNWVQLSSFVITVIHLATFNTHTEEQTQNNDTISWQV